MGRRTRRRQMLKAAVFMPTVAQFNGHWILSGTGPVQGHEASSPGTLGPSFRGFRLGPPHPLRPIGQSRLQAGSVGLPGNGINRGGGGAGRRRRRPEAMAGLARPSHYGPLGSPVEGPGGRRPPRPDWRQLSSGVGVPPGSGTVAPFPPPIVRSTVPETLPPAAEQDSCLLDFDELLNRWETTSGAAYVPKTHGDIYGQPSYRLTPMIERAVGIKDLGEKIEARPFRRPLSMAYQKSETRDKYQGWPNLGPETIMRVGPQPWELADHHAQGPSQAMIPTTKNPVLAGKPFYISDQGVLDRQQPYMTTMARAHRLFSKKQLGICRLKNVKKTLQQSCTQLNRLAVQPLPRATGVSQTQTRVPHRGALSLTQESFVAPQHPMSLPDRFCPLEAPWVAQRQAMPSLQSVPHIYRTESSRYGSLKPTFV